MFVTALCAWVPGAQWGQKRVLGTQICSTRCFWDIVWILRKEPGPLHEQQGLLTPSPSPASFLKRTWTLMPFFLSEIRNLSSVSDTMALILTELRAQKDFLHTESLNTKKNAQLHLRGHPSPFRSQAWKAQLRLTTLGSWTVHPAALAWPMLPYILIAWTVFPRCNWFLFLCALG